MMKKIVVGMLAVGLATHTWAAALQRVQVAADAKWVAHADLEKLRQTQIGKAILDRMSEGVTGNKLTAFAAVVGTDPRTDLNTLTLYGKTDSPKQSVMLVGGNFDETQLVTLLKASDTYQSQKIDRHTVHSWIDANRVEAGRHYGSIHPSGVMAISNGRDMIEEALGVLDGIRPAQDADKLFGSTLQMDAPFFVAAANLTNIADIHPAAAMVFTQTKVIQLMATEKGDHLNMIMALTALDEQAADNVLAVLQGIIAMTMMGEQSNPAMASLAQGTQTSQAGNTVLLNVMFPVEQAISMIETGTASPRQTDTDK